MGWTALSMTTECVSPTVATQNDTDYKFTILIYTLTYYVQFSTQKAKLAVFKRHDKRQTHISYISFYKLQTHISYISFYKLQLAANDGA